jgi:hypothetical protein
MNTKVSERNSAAFLRARRGRNWAMLVVLLALVALFYVLTMVKVAGGAP